jgi:hypothetical protein
MTRAEAVGLLDEAAQRLGPGGEPTSLLEIEAEGAAHDRGRSDDVVREPCRPDQPKRLPTHRPDEVAKPFLALLAEVDRVEEVRARAGAARGGDGAEVRDRHALDRRLAQGEIADRREGRIGELLELLERRLRLTPLPCCEFRELPGEIWGASPGTLPRPAQQLGTHGHAVHAGTSSAGCAEVSLGKRTSDLARHRT